MGGWGVNKNDERMIRRRKEERRGFYETIL
jgi:hypothetical protein